MTDINELLAKLNPKIAAQFKIASEAKNEFLPTPSLGINMAINGLGLKRQAMIWGNAGGGKTALCLQQAAIAQKESKGVAWIDAEKNFEPAWARRMGVDPDQMALSTITSISEMADAGVDLIHNGFDVIIIDSISALLPQSHFDDGELKPLTGTNQIGNYAKNMGTAVNMLNSRNDSTALILISHVRNNIGRTHTSKGPMGGYNIEHMNSTTIKLWASQSDKELIMGNITDGDLVINKPIGRPVTWTIDKSRGPGKGMSGTYDLYFAGDFVGVDLAGEIIDIGIEYGEIKKGGAWYTVGEERLQGRPKAVNYLRSNPVLQEEIYNNILKKQLQ